MITTIALFLSLGIDTLAVAIGLGVAGLPRHRWLAAGLTFAAFEGGMPVVGLLVGQRAADRLGAAAAYLAGSVLIALGGWELRKAIAPGREVGQSHAAVSLDTKSIVAAGLSVSLDELAVGFSLGVRHIPLAPAVAYIAIQALAVTFAGLTIGARAGANLGERSEVVASLWLLVLGVAIVGGELAGAHL